MEPLFSALMATYVYCTAPMFVMANGMKCDDGSEPHRVEMRLMSGRGACPTWDCAKNVETLFEITQDGKILVSVPAGSISKDVMSKLWDAVRPIQR